MSTLRELVQADEEQLGEFQDDIKTIKKELYEHMKQRYWGALVRSGEERVEYEAEPSKVFSTFKREQAARNTINEVSHTGGVASGREEVAGAFFYYYADLFKLRDQQDSIYPYTSRYNKLPSKSASRDSGSD